MGLLWVNTRNAWVISELAGLCSRPCGSIQQPLINEMLGVYADLLGLCKLSSKQ